jgi:type I restriction enzyme, S subunit
MPEWNEYKLNEVYEFASGLSKGRTDFGFGFGFLSYMSIFENYFVPDELDSLVNSTEKERESCSIKRGDVFLTRTSETDEDLGISSVALKDYPNATFNGFTKRLRPSGAVEVLPEYAGFYFRSPRFRAFVSGMSSMTTRASLNNSMLTELKISVPSIETQKSIVKLLFSIHKKIELLSQQSNTLESLAKTIYREWFLVQYDVDWVEKPIEEVCFKISSGGTPSTKVKEYYDGNINWYSTKELTDNFLVESSSKITQKGLDNSSAKLFPENTIVIAIYAAPTVGRLGILSNEGAFNQAACGLIANEEIICFEYLYLHLFHSRRKLNDMASGSAQQNLNVGILKELEIILPSKDLNQQFKEQVRPMFQKIKSNTNQIKTLTKLRDTLLPKLISGEVRVND